MHISSLEEEKLKAAENMCYNKQLCIKLKETEIDDENLCFSAANLCTDLCKPFEKLLQMQKSFIVFITLILFPNRINIYFKFLKTWLLLS